jgi:Cdc6-like AAA superfamily ATPase
MQFDGYKKQKNWLKRCTAEILNRENPNPFPRPPIAANYYNNPPLFCFGRDDYIQDISKEINDSIKYLEPKLIRIMGKQGIGKSTLICYSVDEFNKKIPIPVVYIETSGQPEDFKMKSLYRQIVAKIERTEFFNSLLYRSICKIVTIFKENGGKLEKHLSNKFSGEEVYNLCSNLDYIKARIDDTLFNQKIFEIVNNNAAILNRFIPVDLNFLLSFWKAYIQNPEYMDYLNAFRGNDSHKGFNVKTDNDASIYIDQLIELFRWVFDNNTSFIVILDHLEAGGSELKYSVFSNLFSLLLNLRQKKFMTIILSGTMDAYRDFDEVLQSDQRQQLDNWSKTLALSNLDPETVIMVITRYLINFWEKFNFNPPPDKILFPFGEKSIKYLYENNGQDLRKTLKNLYELIEKYKKTEKIEFVDSFFKAFKAFRTRDDLNLSYIEQRELRNKLLDSGIQDKTRSTSVEIALCNFFEKLSNQPDYNYFTDVKHEPSLGESKKKPDIYLEFFGNEGPEHIKKVGIEVKMYRKSKEVSKGDIEKTYVLLKEKSLDYVIWITNVELKLKHRYNLPKELFPHLGRISKLNDLELAYISFIVYYKEIFKIEPPLQDVEFILNKLSLTPIYIRNKLMELPKLTKYTKPTPEIRIDSFLQPQIDEIYPEVHISEITPTKQRSPIEIGAIQVQENVQEYIDKKSKTNKQISSAATIKAIKKVLKLSEKDKTWDEEIWSMAINLSKSVCKRTTPKTIYFS